LPQGNQGPAIHKAEYSKVERHRPMCHRNSGMEALVLREKYLVVMRCVVCLKEVMRFKIAKEWNEGEENAGAIDSRRIKLTEN